MLCVFKIILSTLFQPLGAVQNLPNCDDLNAYFTIKPLQGTRGPPIKLEKKVGIKKRQKKTKTTPKIPSWKWVLLRFLFFLVFFGFS
jgi:hypothetical protein